MNRISLVIASVATCAATSVSAQESETMQAGPTAIQADREIRDEVVETVFPAERLIPSRPAPVVIERVEIDEVPAYAGAEFARPGTDNDRITAYRVQRAYIQQDDGSRTEIVGLPAGARVVRFDREAWLAECRNRLATHDESDRSKAIGAIAGAAIGGVAGNRIAGSGDRLAGTAAGAAIGALAGGAIGDSIDDGQATPASAYGECEAYLDDYMQSAMNGEFRDRPSHYGQEYMLVPVTISEPRKAVYREVTPSE